MNDPREDLKSGIAELKRRLKSKEIPDRQLVRLTFLALGRVSANEGEGAAKPLAKGLSEAAEPHGERWDEAVESEMTLAVSEHVHGVDPKYLDMPGYDFAYTIAARERLEQRLVAAELLKWKVTEHLLDQVADADARLLPYIEKG
jgi:hypothetical protein